MEQYPAVVRKWKDVLIGDVVLIGNPADFHQVTAISSELAILGKGRRYIDINPTPDTTRSYLRFDDEWATILVKDNA